ncbi:MAG: hypothetical protein J7621_19590 [Niastella sp.]|nr:hypothetical protein [Niastella sp.]
MMKHIMVMALLCLTVNAKAQTCNCEKEFLHIRNIVEHNFAGYPDKVKELTPAVYQKKAGELLKLTRAKFAGDNCPMIIYQYLDLFKSNHLGFSLNLDYAKVDTGYVNHRPVFEISDKELTRLKRSTSWEGIYYFVHDSSMKIAVIKDPTALHDYVGVTIESTRPTWKKGLVKWEGKLINDSLLQGVLYMRNHRPKWEGFNLHSGNTMIGGDWRREGAPIMARPQYASNNNKPSPVIDARSLTSNTFYFKMGSCDMRYKPVIDSLLKANESLLNSTPNLILDLRDNGGGGDDSWWGFVPYLYTQPIKSIGADVWATETTISMMKKYLDDKSLSQELHNYFSKYIARMEQSKGQWMMKNEDEIDSSFQPKPFPKKIVILMNRWCGSSTEELLLTAQQSSKVILAGENTVGNLDYSNIVPIRFSCYPYTLVYATTRSRRLNIGQGIDNVGIAPQYRLAEIADWIQEALKIVETKE